MRTRVMHVVAGWRAVAIATALSSVAGPGEVIGQSFEGVSRFALTRQLEDVDPRIRGLERSEKSFRVDAALLPRVMDLVEALAFDETVRNDLAVFDESLRALREGAVTGPWRDHGLGTALQEQGRALDQRYHSLWDPLTRSVNELADEIAQDLEASGSTAFRFSSKLQSIYREHYEVHDRLDAIVSPTDYHEAVTSLFDLSGVKPKLVNAIQQQLSESEDRLESVMEELDDLRGRRDALVAEIGKRDEGQVQIDKQLITYALPAFGFLIVVLLLVPRLYAVETQSLIFESGLPLELITVFLLTATTLLLGVAGKLPGEVLGTLLAGISGYVLGRATGGRQSSSGA